MADDNFWNGKAYHNPADPENNYVYVDGNLVCTTIGQPTPHVHKWEETHSLSIGGDVDTISTYTSVPSYTCKCGATKLGFR